MSEKSTTPLVSVIMPVYNVAPYLRQCLDSICNQTLTDIEIICVDDGSTDDSISILREYEKNDSRVTVVLQQNQFAGAARQKGMEMANGKYFAFVDSDDFFELNMLEEMTNKAEVHDSDIVVCNADVYRESEGKLTPAPWLLRMDMLGDTSPDLFAPMDVIGDRLFHFVRLTPWGKIFKSDFVKQHNLKWQSLSRANDVLFVGSALALAKSMSVIDNVYVHYRARANSTAHSNSRSEQALLDAYLALRDNLIKHNASAKALHAANTSLMSILVYDLSRLDAESSARLLSFVQTEVEPKMHLIELPEYDNPYVIQPDYFRYKSFVKPAVTVVLRESIGKNERGLDAHLKMLTSIKDLDFEIVCISNNEKSKTWSLFEQYSKQSLLCRHIHTKVDDSLPDFADFCRGSVLVDTLTTQANSITIRKVLGKIANMPYLPYQIHKFEYLEQIAPAAPNAYPIKKTFDELLSVSQGLPKVSIIVPVYQAKQHIATTIACLQNQTLEDIEMIFVDDKGGDGTFDIVRKAAETDPRILCVENEKNSGPGATRNAGIKSARGEYIAFVDADDIIPSNFYELLYTKAKDYSLLVVKGGARVVSPDGAAFNTTLNKFIAANISKHETLLNLFRYDHWTAIFDRKLVISVSAEYATDINRGEDNHFLMMVGNHVGCEKFAIVDEAVYYYIQHNDSIVHTSKGLAYLSSMKKSLSGRLGYILDSCADTPDTRKYIAYLFEGMLSWIFTKAISEGGITFRDAYMYLNHVSIEYNRFKTTNRQISPESALSTFIRLDCNPMRYLVNYWCERKGYKNHIQTAREISIIRKLEKTFELSEYKSSELDNYISKLKITKKRGFYSKIKRFFSITRGNTNDEPSVVDNVIQDIISEITH